MTGAFAVRRVFTVAVLAAAWCGLWSDVSVANVLAGAAVGLAVTVMGLGTAGRGGIRLLPLLQLIGLVLVDLVQSTVDVAWQIVRPPAISQEAIISVEVPAGARHHLLLLVVAITLTPGTAVVDADPDTGMVYLHLLRADTRAATEEHVKRLAELVCVALPVGPDAPARRGRQRLQSKSSPHADSSPAGGSDS